MQSVTKVGSRGSSARPLNERRQPLANSAAPSGEVITPVLHDAGVVDLEPIVVNVIEASRALSISPRTLASLTWPKGPIRAKRIRSCLRYPVSELRRYVDSLDEGGEP